jgi:hypothetical protein
MTILSIVFLIVSFVAGISLIALFISTVDYVNAGIGQTLKDFEKYPIDFCSSDSVYMKHNSKVDKKISVNLDDVDHRFLN